MSNRNRLILTILSSIIMVTITFCYYTNASAQENMFTPGTTTVTEVDSIKADAVDFLVIMSGECQGHTWVSPNTWETQYISNSEPTRLVQTVQMSPVIGCQRIVNH